MQVLKFRRALFSEVVVFGSTRIPHTRANKGLVPREVTADFAWSEKRDECVGHAHLVHKLWASHCKLQFPYCNALVAAALP